MKSFFDQRNPFWQFFGKLFDALVLHFLWLFTCIPIFTIGPATVALYYVLMKVTRDEGNHYFRMYFRAFKENFRESFPFGILFLIVAALLFLAALQDQNLYEAGGGNVFNVLQYVNYGILVLWIMIFEYVFPLVARFRNTFVQTMKNACLMAIRHVGWTLTMTVLLAAFYFVVIWWFQYLFMLIIFGFGFIVLVNSYIMNHIFKSYIEKTEEAFEEADSENLAEKLTAGSLMVQYDAVPSDGDTERLYLYTPCEKGFVRWNFAHYVNIEKNADTWILHPLYAVAQDLTECFPLTAPGEFECAIRIKGAPDFMGGSTHGSERDTAFGLFVDGQERALWELAIRKKAEGLRVVVESNLYDPSDETTVVALHTREYLFTKENLVIHQSVVWQKSVEIGRAYLAMFPVTKAVSDYISLDSGEPHAFADGFVKAKLAESAVAWSDAAGFRAEFRVTRWDIEGRDLTDVKSFLTTDNGREDYNKMYFVAAGSGKVSEGDKWQTTTEYKIRLE